MSLKVLYNTIQQTSRFALDDLPNYFVSELQTSRGGTWTSDTINVTKIEMHQQALEELRSIKSQKLKRTRTQAYGEDLGVTIDLGTSSFGSSGGTLFQGSVQLRSVVSEREKELQLLVTLTDYDRVMIDGTLGDTTITVHVEVFYVLDILQMFAEFRGFDEPARALFDALCTPGATWPLDTVTLSDHRVVFATADMPVRIGDIEIRLGKGTNAVAGLDLGTDVGKLVQPQQQFIVFGALPEEDGETVQFQTAPHFTLQVGTMQVENAYVAIVNGDRTLVDDDGTSETFRNTFVAIVGSAAVGSSRRTLFAHMPLDGELLLFEMVLTDDPAAIHLSDLDGLMGGSAWRDALPAGLRDVDGVVSSYHHTTYLTTGQTTSVALTVSVKNAWFQFKDARFEFLDFVASWVVGFPDDASLTNVFARGEGDVIVKTANQTAGLQGDVEFTPGLVVVARGANTDLQLAIALGKDLDLDDPESPTPWRVGQPWTMVLIYDDDDDVATLMINCHNGAEIIW